MPEESTTEKAAEIAGKGAVTAAAATLGCPIVGASVGVALFTDDDEGEAS